MKAADGQDILLLAEPDAQAELSAALGGRCQCHQDPYLALEALSRRPWPVVVLTAPRSELAALCRAVRRLAPACRLFALCAPATEMDVRRLVGGPIDDYFIYPPTSADLAAIGAAASREEPARGRPAAGIAPAELAELVAAATDVESLERQVAALMGSAGAGKVWWTDADKMPPGSRLILAMGEEPRRVLAGEQEPSAAAAALAGALADLLPALLACARRAESLQRLAITDHLTGAYNRRYFYHVTDQILARARQGNSGVRVTLLLYDIDDFKHYNDTYGYAAGDEILRETAALMKRITRSHDIVARIGGDEFAVLFWDADRPRSPTSKPPESPRLLAERFARAVRTYNFPSLGREAQGVLTVSGGLASFPRDGQNVRELLRSADHAIKAAKRCGKNAIHIVGPKPQIE